MMTVKEKRDHVLAELMACVKQILSNETNTLNKAKWQAACAVRTSQIISSEGRVPSMEETIEWVKRQGWAFLN